MTPSPLVHTRRSTTATAALAATALLLLVPAALTAQQEGEEEDAARDSTATLTGKVVSAMTGGPLQDVRVVLKRSGLGAFTDSAGDFTIKDAPPGRDTVQVSLIGFAEEQVSMSLRPGHVTRVTLMLSKTVLRVEDITVEVKRREEIGKLSGFWERERKGLGAFLTPEEIEKKNPQYPSALLRGVPGVQVGAYRFGRAQVRITRARTDCPPIYYVDGTISRSFHLDDMNRDDILAMEIYRGSSEVPARFRFQGGNCGVIVVWTREGRNRRLGGG